MSRLEQAVHLSAPAAGFQPASSGRIWYTLYAPYTQSCPTVLRTASAAGSFFANRIRRWLFLRTAMRRVTDHRHIPRRYGTTSRCQSCHAAPGRGGSYARRGLQKEWSYRLEHLSPLREEDALLGVQYSGGRRGRPRHGATAPVSVVFRRSQCHSATAGSAGQASVCLRLRERAAPRGVRRASLTAVPEAPVSEFVRAVSEKQTGQGQGGWRATRS